MWTQIRSITGSSGDSRAEVYQGRKPAEMLPATADRKQTTQRGKTQKRDQCHTWSFCLQFPPAIPGSNSRLLFNSAHSSHASGGCKPDTGISHDSCGLAHGAKRDSGLHRGLCAPGSGRAVLPIHLSMHQPVNKLIN